jgi:CRP-like cAMP-binding protein
MAQLIEDSTDVITLTNDQILFEEGEPGSFLYVVLAGNIRIYKEQDGEKVPLNDLREGDVIGTLSLMENANRSAGAISIGISKVKMIDAKKITSMLDSDIPKWYQAILKDIIGRFKQLEEKYMALQKAHDNLKEVQKQNY